jgi:ferric-dicitrate binding protein FerR (iron transport regulator)
MTNGADERRKETERGEAKSAEDKSRRRLVVGILAGMATVILPPSDLMVSDMSIDAPDGTIATVASETRQLKDGSLLKLQDRSILEFAFTDKRRDFHLLEGAVTVAAAKDPMRPLVVLARDVLTTALEDAKFSVTIDSGVIVQVLEGVVQVSRRGADVGAPVITLKKGERRRLGAAGMSKAVLAARSDGSTTELVDG